MTNRQKMKAAVLNRVAPFLRNESGAMAPIMLIFFFLMLVIGGIAVDLMRFESRRVALQQTMDRATLAAASLENSLDPRDVVESYFAAAGIEGELDDVEVIQAMNSRTVRATAKVRSHNYFMSMLDVPYLAANNISQAEQRVTNVEIALVLDVSGSMYNQPTRIANLKTAAKEFVDTVLDNDTENKISIALVPYNGQVNLGPLLFSKFTASNKHSYANSYCLDLPTSVYNSTTLSRITAFPQTPFADIFSTTNQSTGYVALDNNYGTPRYDTVRKLYVNVFCNPVAGNFVRLHNNNRTTLKSQIDGLVAIGATSIDLGMKWGTFLLDPSSRSITSEMVGAGGVPGYFSNRPADYEAVHDDEKTVKVIVLMTDGENFEGENFTNSYRTGPAAGTAPTGNFTIWKGNSDNNYSVFFDSKVDSKNSTTICNSRPFWVPHVGSGGAWHSRPWNGSTPSTSTCYSKTATYTGATIQNWEQIWQTARVQWVAWQLFARPLGTTSSQRSTIFTNQMNAFRSNTDTDTMDARLESMCAVAKSKDILIYGIAFEAPEKGVNAIRNCVAAAPPGGEEMTNEQIANYFYDVSGLQIRTAFRMIASNLSQLRLTQ